VAQVGTGARSAGTQTGHHRRTTLATASPWVVQGARRTRQGQARRGKATWRGRAGLTVSSLRRTLRLRARTVPTGDGCHAAARPEARAHSLRTHVRSHRNRWKAVPRRSRN
jgi:hypothetical protein